VELVDIGREDIEDVFIFVIDDMELAIAPCSTTPTKQRRSEESVDDSAEAPEPAAEPGAAKSAPGQESVRVQAERLDELMNRVGELVIAQSRLRPAFRRKRRDRREPWRAVSEDIQRLPNCATPPWRCG
jgi:two-component system chemotaxis sensor kinase CheA